ATPASPVYGSVTCDASSTSTRGNCTYQSVDYFVGDDGFDYSIQQAWGSWTVHVTVHVVATDHAPVAREDRATAYAGGAAVAISPLANDSDVDAELGTADVLKIASYSPPALMNGTFTCDTANVCTYTPGFAGWSGVITIPYTVTDQSALSGGPLVASGTINIFVDPAPLVVWGFHDSPSTSQVATLGSWGQTTSVTAPTGTCTAKRPATTVTWTAPASTAHYVVQRRVVTGMTTGPWVTVAYTATTSFTDTRVGEGRTYQWQVQPDLYRWRGTYSSASAPSTQPAAANATGC
ncbi:MAG: cell wall anchor protein, partial [Acidobacteria bacterium]|nr:cell wall anchor protein [Acidobacteriota bacterium]